MTELIDEKFKWLKNISLQFINEEDFEKIQKSSAFLSFKKGEPILKQGGLSTHVVYLQKGIVKFSYENDLHKNTILTLVAAPKILGGANLFYKDNNLFSIIAIEECEALLIDSSVLVDILMNNSKYAMMLFQLASEMFKKSILQFISMSYKHKEGRIAEIILYLSSDIYKSESFKLSLSRREISEFAGCSPENVIMTLSKWKKEKIVKIENKLFTILDISRLRRISKLG